MAVHIIKQYSGFNVSGSRTFIRDADRPDLAHVQ